MKNLLKFAASAVLIFSISAITYAQQGPGRGRNSMDPKEFAERQTNHMKESLELTDDQLPKVEALNLKYAEKMNEARVEADGDRKAMRDSMRAMISEKDEELKKILTADQWIKFEEIRKERMQNRGSGRRRGI
ncbi:MAG: DUF4890 domain-containing protein [Cytophagales bacterium]|nr:DUF4890 domain-containing protein [Cytophagales bacterium]